MTVSDWLNSQLYRDNADVKVIHRLCELMTCNGGKSTVHGWGFLSSADHPYGRSGLEQDEALELIHFDGVLTGFSLATNGASCPVVDAMLVEEIGRVDAIWRTNKASADTPA